MRRTTGLVLMSGLLAIASQSHAGIETLAELQQEWAHITYQVPEALKAQSLDALGRTAEDLVNVHSDDAEFMIWQGIILSSYAGQAGGLGALSAAKKARTVLERSLEINATALSGSAYTSLGALYHKVPGWPIGFGSDKKARGYLEQALGLNPTGIDPNYFMGEFLYEEGDYPASKRFLENALAAADRPGREVADTGRRQEVQAILSKLVEKM